MAAIALRDFGSRSRHACGSGDAVDASTAWPVALDTARSRRGERVRRRRRPTARVLPVDCRSRSRTSASRRRVRWRGCAATESTTRSRGTFCDPAAVSGDDHEPHLALSAALQPRSSRDPNGQRTEQSGVNPAFALTGSSSALGARGVERHQSAGLRVDGAEPPLNRSWRPGSFAATQIVRADGARPALTNSFEFYLLRFEQACNPSDAATRRRWSHAGDRGRTGRACRSTTTSDSREHAVRLRRYHCHQPRAARETPAHHCACRSATKPWDALVRRLEIRAANRPARGFHRRARHGRAKTSAACRARRPRSTKGTLRSSSGSLEDSSRDRPSRTSSTRAASNAGDFRARRERRARRSTTRYVRPGAAATRGRRFTTLAVAAGPWRIPRARSLRRQGDRPRRSSRAMTGVYTVDSHVAAARPMLAPRQSATSSWTAALPDMGFRAKAGAGLARGLAAAGVHAVPSAAAVERRASRARGST